MYLRRAMKQMTFDSFDNPFGFPISQENRWVKLAAEIPWDDLEAGYAEKFERTDGKQRGNVALPFRTALGSLIIRRVMKLSDRGTVKAIQENPYYQYFLGFERYIDEPPFDPSMMVHFRKRIDLDAMKEIADTLRKFEKKTPVSGEQSDTAAENTEETECRTDSNEVPMRVIADVDEAAIIITKGIFNGATNRRDAMELGLIENHGTMIIDASCSPVNIRYPQDFSLLNEAREKLDALIGKCSHQLDEKKPRTYCRTARTIYLNLAKSKRRSVADIRKVIKKMLSFVKRNLKYLDSYLTKGCLLTDRETKTVETIRTLYEQQKYMYDQKVNRVENRIVSIHMPFIRPIVRGKVPQPTEFGPKYDLSVDENGNKRIEYFSYEAYNEATHLQEALEAYKERNGCYPAKVLADTIYRNRENRKFCQNRDIKMSGPKLGRPAKENGKSKEERRAEKRDQIERIEVERKFSREKRCFGLGKIMEKLESTVGSSVGLGVLLDNLIPVGF